MRTFPIKGTLKLSLLAAIVVLTSCTKEEPIPVPVEVEIPVAPAHLFSAKVDGDQFQQWVTDAFVHTSTNTINIASASNGGYPAIVLQISKGINPGGYPFSAGLGTFGLYSLGTDVNDKYGAAEGTGVLVISSHDKAAGYISGTFYYTATPLPGNTNTDSFVVSEGSFAFNY